MDKKVSIDNILYLEQPLMKVPAEQLHKTFRNTRKLLDKEMSYLQQNIPTTQDGIDSAISRLKTLKRKLSECQAEEQKFIKRVQIRSKHLTQIAEVQSMDDEVYQQWTRTRLIRILVDYLLRKGYFDAADALTNHYQVQEYVDVELFASTRKIEESLRNRSCTEALQWCVENKSHLKKGNSDFEFNLRKQEYIELVKAKDYLGAIQYARKYLNQYSSGQMGKEVQKLMTLLVLSEKKHLPSQYKKQFSQDNWVQLVQQFKQENYNLNQLTSHTLLEIVLQGGLIALKNPSCMNSLQHSNQSSNSTSQTRLVSDLNPNCPVCNFPFNILAEKVPLSHHTTSCIVCRVWNVIMDEDNPPMVLENGNVYCKGAIEEMKDKSRREGGHDGKIKDPQTGEWLSASKIKKIFLA
ncbi:hypothetical protein MIR68_000044 [Amoeboaphelidium protococcarum]|nr:hypothetical protein MIR68_000044 [Amoeboaphelidium protococcarum]